MFLCRSHYLSNRTPLLSCHHSTVSPVLSPHPCHQELPVHASDRQNWFRQLLLSENLPKVLLTPASTLCTSLPVSVPTSPDSGNKEDTLLIQYFLHFRLHPLKAASRKMFQDQFLCTTYRSPFYKSLHCVLVHVLFIIHPGWPFCNILFVHFFIFIFVYIYLYVHFSHYFSHVHFHPIRRTLLFPVPIYVHMHTSWQCIVFYVIFICMNDVGIKVNQLK